MATRYAHTHLIAHDWEKIAAFYVRVFALIEVQSWR